MPEELRAHIVLTSDVAGAEAARRALGSVASGAREIAAEIPGVGGVVSTLAGMAGPAAIAAAGVGLVVQSLREFGQAQAAVTRLDQALANTGQLTDDLRERLQRLADTMQTRTAIAGEEWLAVMQRLVTMGRANAENIEEHVRNVERLAGLMGGDLNTAALLYSRAMQGHTEMLARYLPELRGLNTEEERRAKAMEALARGEGMLAAKAQTQQGRLRAYSLALKDVARALGAAIADTQLYADVTAHLDAVARGVSETMGSTIPKAAGLENKYKSLALIEDQVALSAEGMGEATEKAAEQAAKAMERWISQMDRVAAGQDALKSAELALKIAEIERAEAAGEIEPEAAAVAKAETRLAFERESGAAKAQAAQERVDQLQMQVDAQQRQLGELLAAMRAPGKRAAAGAVPVRELMQSLFGKEVRYEDVEKRFQQVWYAVQAQRKAGLGAAPETVEMETRMHRLDELRVRMLRLASDEAAAAKATETFGSKVDALAAMLQKATEDLDVARVAAQAASAAAQAAVVGAEATAIGAEPALRRVTAPAPVFVPSERPMAGPVGRPSTPRERMELALPTVGALPAMPAPGMTTGEFAARAEAAANAELIQQIGAEAVASLNGATNATVGALREIKSAVDRMQEQIGNLRNR